MSLMNSLELIEAKNNKTEIFTLSDLRWNRATVEF